MGFSVAEETGDSQDSKTIVLEILPIPPIYPVIRPPYFCIHDLPYGHVSFAKFFLPVNHFTQNYRHI